MEHTANSIAPEASTDRRASSLNPPQPETEDPSDWPEFATRAEAMAFWQGVRRGVRDAGRDLAHPHLPGDFPLNLARDGEAPALTSAAPLDPWPYDPGDELHRGQTSHGPVLAPDPAAGRAACPEQSRGDRRDGFTHAAEQLFLRTLADTGVVADACRATGITRQAAYARRRSAAGRAFALAWDAALLIARGAIADDVMSRARHGVIERVYRDGQLVAERHKYDNRLTMAVLARLDRLAETAAAPVAKAVAQEFDQFLGLLPQGLEAAEQFVALRFPDPPRNGEGDRDAKCRGGGGDPQVGEPAGIFGRCPPSGTEQALLARLYHYEEHGVGLPAEIDTGDLAPKEMASWTGEQFDRARASGFLEMLHETEWPQAARDPAPDDGADTPDGMCQMRQLYRLHHPPAAAAPEPDDDDFCGCSIWEDDSGEWRTDFPPPPGFDDYEQGEPGACDYQRVLAPEEQAIIDAQEALDRLEDEARLPNLHAARRRFFGLDDAAEGSEGR